MYMQVDYSIKQRFRRPTPNPNLLHIAPRLPSARARLCSYGKLHDMEGVRLLIKAAVAHRRGVLLPAAAQELEALVRDSR